ncbi:MAG: tRNA (adenosine(37)-N6)-threonylcarbamoyltransferase complex dimerization subunit type 1 TsaB [Candidatus Omnitrophota bacterium]
MKLLAIETSGKYFSLALYDGSRIYEHNIEVGSKLSSLLHITINRALEALAWRIKDIDYFICAIGPGSFTGTRFGLAVMKGFSWALNKPLIGISSLDIIAQNVIRKGSRIFPIIDAKRNLVYCSIYKARGESAERVSPYMLLNERELLGKIKGDAIILGDAVGLLKDKIMANAKNSVIMSSDYWYPRGQNIIKLALERIKKKEFDDPSKIVPIYLYPKECQIRK